MMGYTLSPETLQVISSLATAIGIVLLVILVAFGLAHFGHRFIMTQMD